MVRSLFISIVANNQPENPEALFRTCWSKMCDDLRPQVQLPEDHPNYEETLRSLTRKTLTDELTRMGRDAAVSMERLSPEKLEELTRHTTYVEVTPEARLVREEQDVDREALRREADANRARATPSQRVFIEEVIRAVDAKEPKLFFLNAPGGTGAPRVRTVVGRSPP
jgi:hypothetical protein